MGLQVIVFIIHRHCFQVSFARAQLAKKINLHLKELSITFRRNFRNMLIIGVSPSLELDFFPLLLFSRIAAFLFLDSETLGMTASHSVVAWHSVRNITSFLYLVISISRRFFRKETEGPFWCKFCFLLVVHMQMTLVNNAKKNDDAHL